MTIGDSLCAFPGSKDGQEALAALYGQKAMPAQTARWERLIRSAKGFAGLKGARLFSGPGRTELGGNHSDHQGGRVLCAAVRLDMAACVRPSPDGTVRVDSSGWAEPIVVDLSDLSPRAAEAGTPQALIRGVASALRSRGASIGGFSGAVDSQVPSGSGLSSSAAFEVLIGRIYNNLYNGGSIAPEVLAQAGREAENLHFGKPCGLMDQMACALGGVTSIDFRNETPLWERADFRMDGCGYGLAILHTGGSHDDLTRHYAAIPAQMRNVAAAFGQSRLRGLSEDQLLKRSRELRSIAGDRAFLRALHFVREDGRAAAMAGALAAGDMRRFLALARASGDSSWRLLQNLCAPGSDREQGLAVAVELASGFLGDSGVARVHGGGFAGTAQAWVPDAMREEFEFFITSQLGPGSLTWVAIRPQGATEIQT